MGEFAGGLDFAKEYIGDASAFAAGEPCDNKGVGGVDERGDGERATGDEHDGDFVACFLPLLNLCDVFVGAVERHVSSRFLGNDFVVEIVAAVVAEPFCVWNFTDDIDDCSCFFGGGNQRSFGDFVETSLD